jgi:hypothetical protein
MGLKDRLIHWLLRIYPECWRSEYGPELEAMLESRELTAWKVLDVARGGLAQRMRRGEPWDVAAPSLFMWALTGMVWNTLSPLPPLVYNAYNWIALACLFAAACATTWRGAGNGRAAVLGAWRTILICMLPEILVCLLWTIGVVHPVILNMQGQSGSGLHRLTLLSLRSDVQVSAFGTLCAATLVPSIVGLFICSIGAAFGAGARVLRDASK